MRMRTAVGACAGMLLWASMARAQVPAGEFGQRGEVIVSADRLFPLFSYTHFSQDQFVPGAGNSKQVLFSNQTSISLLWGSASGPSVAVGSDAAAIETFFTVPRVGIDYVLAHHVTIGGDLAIYFTIGGNTGSDSTMANGGAVVTSSNGNPSVLVLGLAPRGGYILPLTDMFSLWLRGGFSYFVASSKTTTGAGAGQQTVTTTTNQLALDLDPQLVITPFPHVGFTAGVTTDLPITGGHSSDTTPANGATVTQSASSSVLFFGITAGMLVYF
jgi:hypothetical protein